MNSKPVAPKFDGPGNRIRGMRVCASASLRHDEAAKPKRFRFFLDGSASCSGPKVCPVSEA